MTRSRSYRPRSRARGAVVIVAVLAALVGAVGAPASAHADTTPAALYLRPIVGTSEYVSGLDKPWDLAFLPDGTMIYTLKKGEIWARVGSTTMKIASIGKVLVAGEGGLMGLAVDPQFATNRRIYACMLSRDDGRPDDVRVVRWRVADDLGGLSQRTDIVTGIGVNTMGSLGRHSGCRPRFGPDGYLWIGTGDAAMPTFPQDPNQLAGKVLRVDADGNGAPGNAGGAFREEIYNYGHRNVQGIAFRPSDGKAYSVEHGTSRDDEVNLLVSGANYGWDPVNAGGAGYYDESRPMTDLVKFPTAMPAVWSSGYPTMATSGASFVTGSQWLGWDGSLVVGVLKDSRLMALTLSSDGMSVVERTDRVFDRGRLRSVVQGPDGNLYVNQDNSPGAILRVTPGANCAFGFSQPFPDVSVTDAFCPEITWAKQIGLVSGYPDGTFGPGRAVSRQALAHTLNEFAVGTGDEILDLSFSDVPPGHAFHDDIEWLADTGLAAGYPDGTFRPASPVTRQAFASFVYKVAGSPAVSPSAATFSDVPPGHQFHDAIEWLAAQDITTGYPDGGFHPGATVSRQAMAVMLYRAEDLRPQAI